jgi:hypothetical protein
MIKFYREDGEYGFIEAEDFRDDVFFHRRAWQGDVPPPSADSTTRSATTSPAGKSGPAQSLEPQVEMWVEFELDDDHFANEKKLRAKVVRPTSRPSGKRMTAKDANFQFTYHHPKARKKRPTWRQ